jgi:hypothetical protein
MLQLTDFISVSSGMRLKVAPRALEPADVGGSAILSWRARHTSSGSSVEQAPNFTEPDVSLAIVHYYDEGERRL